VRRVLRSLGLGFQGKTADKKRGVGRLGVRVSRATKLPLLTGRCGPSQSERGALLEGSRRGWDRRVARAGCGAREEGPGRGGAGPRTAAERPGRRGREQRTRGPWLAEGERERREARLGLRREWAGRGPCGKKERWASGSAWAREKRERERWFWAGCWALSFSSSFLFLFHTQTIQTIIFEFK
jgi:hypothetical protein